MKNTKLLLSSMAFIAGISLFIIFSYIDVSPKYQSRKTMDADNYKERDANGAIAYNFSLRKNQITGRIDYSDVYAAQQAVVQRTLLYKTTASLNLNWTELGPDNIGGRTRAILIDKDNPNRIYAGGVAGGLWISDNAAATWKKYNDLLENLAITCITQAPNGDIYFGTGEGLYDLTGTGSAGIAGGGIWKSTDRGSSFKRLTKTIPATSNSGSVNWAAVNQIATDPVNPNRIYAATNKGLRISDDGGETWVNPISFITNQQATDVDVASDDGTVIAAINGKGYLSSTGNTGTFSIISNTGLPDYGGRIEFAIAPSNPNYMYASAAKSSPGTLEGVYQSTDKGESWSLIGKGNRGSLDPKVNYQFEPFGRNGQGDYDNTLAVFPHDPLHIVLGGVELWSWKSSPNSPSIGQWTKIAVVSPNSPINTLYVHADVHTLKFPPTTNDNIFYIGTDGGIFKTTDGGNTYKPMNRGYNVTQFYSVAFKTSEKTGVMGGTQDNGTLYISGTGNTAQNAVEVGGGDGGKCEISFLNPKAFFATVYYGSLSRSSSEGTSPTSFYSDRIKGLSPKVGEIGFAAFVTPVALYESTNAANSSDSINFVASSMSENIFGANGTAVKFSGTLKPTQSSASIVPGTIKFTAGTQVVTDDGAGNLIGNINAKGTNTINYATGTFYLDFANPPSAVTLIKAGYNVQYNPGSIISLKSKTSNYPFKYTTPALIAVGDTVKVQDIVQSKLAVGFARYGYDSLNLNRAPNKFVDNGVWMTKSPLDFSKTPEWFRILNLNLNSNLSINSETRTMAWSPDGDILYVGTSIGEVYRISNLAAVTDSINGDVASSSCIVKSAMIANFNRTITSIAVNPNNGDSIIVTLGNYGNSDYVYLCGNATTAIGTGDFVSKQGLSTFKLPAMPVYGAIFNKANTKSVILATEYGVYATDNIKSSNVVWTEENGSSLAHVPTFAIRQQTWSPQDVSNSGTIYIATHGRGIWKSENFLKVGIKDNALTSNSSSIKPGIMIYPNPLKGENATVSFDLKEAGKGQINIYDLQGRIAKSITLSKLQAGTNKISFDSSELSSGTYLLSLDAEDVHASTRFVVIK